MNELARIPLELRRDEVDGGVEVYVEVVADGTPFTCLLDSGAATTQLPANGSIADRAAIDTNTARGASGEPIVTDTVLVGEVTIGSSRASDVAVERGEPGGRAMLGRDVLRRWICQFDLSRGALSLGTEPGVIWRSSLPDPDGGPRVPFETAGGIVEGYWDTGASLSAVDLTWARERGILHDDALLITGRDAARGLIESWSCRLPGGRVGGVETAASDAVAVDLSGLNQHVARPVEVILGWPWTSQADWWMDFERGRWAVDLHRP